MFGVPEMAEIREKVGAYAGGFDPALVTAADAQRIVEHAIAAENMLSTVKALAARRVADTELWRKDGDSSAAHHLARKAGTSVSNAKQALDMAGRLSQLPALEAAARAGEVSSAQAGPISDAAAKAPEAAPRLVESAKRGCLGELLDECARTKAAAEPDDEARHRAIRAARFLRKKRCADGAGELHYRSTLEEVAEIFAIAQGYGEREFRAARAEGRREPAEAYLADGLLAAVRASCEPAGGTGDGTGAGGAGAGGAGTGAAGPSGAGAGGGDGGRFGTAVAGDETGGAGATGDSDEARAGGAGTAVAEAATEVGTGGGASAGGAAVLVRRRRPPSPAKVVVRIDWDALVRGWPIDGEVCEISGLGPVAVSAVRAMVASGDAFLAAVVTKGNDVATVAHLGRRPSAAQQSALEWLSPTCSVAGCNTSVRLETDHRKQWATTKITLLRLLDEVCGHHHDLKTYQGWALVEGVGKRAMVPPDDPRHPRNSNHGPAPP